MAGVKGRSGPRPKPVAIHKMNGTYRKDRQRGGESPDANIPDRPKIVTGEARKEWERMAPKLAKAGLLSSWDIATFTMYCLTWKEFLAVSRKLKKLSDYVATTSNGNVIQSPLVGIKNQVYKRLLQICTEFGLTPSSRASLNVGAVSEELDPLEEIMRMTG